MAEAKKEVTKKTAKKPAKKVDEKIEEKVEVSTEVIETKQIAKAGKRSTKAIKEAEEKQAKEERKTATKTEKKETEKPKQVQNPPRSKVERKGKNYRKNLESIDKTKLYALSEALELAAKTSPTKFDATVELHVRLGVDPRQADQNIRDSVILPAGSGKSIKVAVFGEEKDVTAAKQAGADVAKSDEFLEQLDKEQIDFDLLIATPAVMVKLSKYARLLGPKGLMPNPKNGSVTNDVAKAVKEAKTGKVEYRIDSSGIIHLGIGKVSFGKDKLTENAQAVLTSIKSNKPATLKGNYVNSIYVTTSMGPSIQIDKNI